MHWLLEGITGWIQNDKAEGGGKEDKLRDLKPQASFFSEIASEGRKRGYLNLIKDYSKA